jgi:hypothetical protein
MTHRQKLIVGLTGHEIYKYELLYYAGICFCNFGNPQKNLKLRQSISKIYSCPSMALERNEYLYCIPNRQKLGICKSIF